MSNQTKRHHFIPRFILNRFYSVNLGKKQLRIFNKKTGNLNIKGKSSKSVCYHEHLYTIYIGSDSFIEIEKLYSKIESKFADLISKINDEDDFFLFQENLSEDYNHEHWKIISFFLNLSFWRLPNSNKYAETLKHNLRSIYRNATDEIKSIIPMGAKELKFFEKNNSSLAKSITNYIILPACLSKVNHSILGCKFVRTDFDLIISDRPIVCTIDTDTGEMYGDIYMPLSPRLCITNNAEKIVEFQKKIFLNAENIVIANTDNVLIDVHNQIQRDNK